MRARNSSSPAALAAVGLLAAASPVSAQDAVQLEGIIVSSPSPIASGGDIAIGTQPAGSLIVVDDAFVPVTVVTDRDILAQSGANIADTLDKKPGIVSSSFAPGASRPIVRGLDAYRVRVQENGIGSHDVSALSEDHAVPIDPFAANQVEVIRGPATLRYGSQAIGGVIAVENGRIPPAVPRGGFTAELKGDATSVDEGRNGAFRATAGTAAGPAGIVVHADGFRRRTDDYDTPRGRQFNSFVEADGGALGASIVGDQGFIGVAVSRYQSFYGVPGEEAAELRPRIDLEQDKVQARGEWRVGGFGIEALRFWFGASDYAHNEVVDEGEGDEIGSRFTTETYEARFEAQHIPIVTTLGQLRGAIGVQFTDTDIRGQSFEGDSLLAPANTESIAAFWFEELDLTRQLTLQAAARIEKTEIDGSSRRSPLDPALPLVSLSRDYTPVSASLGGLFKLPQGSVISLSGQYVERAPDAAKLFSGGIHEATGTFEIGNPDLEKEKATSVELGIRKADGPFRYDATAFYTRYDGFIFRQLTGLECEGTLASCGEDDGHGAGDHGHEALDQVLFGQRDASFFGVELAGQYEVAPIWNGVWGIEGQYDFVRARFDEGGNVPRIPPHRLGGGLFYRDATWFARAGVLHAFDQDEIGANEIATPGYTLVSAELSYSVALDSDAGLGPSMTIGIKGENLADDEVLNHASFKRREDVLLPGANVRVFGSLKLN